MVSLEVMLQRRGLGFHWSLNETLNDTSVAHVPLRILIGSSYFSEKIRHQISVDFQYSIVPFFAPLQNTTPQVYAQKYRTAYAPLKGDFPINVHLISLETSTSTNGDDVLLRLANLNADGEEDYTVDLRTLFSDYLPIEDVKVMSLTATSVLSVPSAENGEVSVVTPAGINTIQFQFTTTKASPKRDLLWLKISAPIVGTILLVAVGIYYYRRNKTHGVDYIPVH